MRNIFDQYQQPENRLTHALASCLDADPKLMRSFLKDFSKVNIPRNIEPTIVEQQLPGVQQLDSDEKSSGSLPDAWIFGDQDWSLLIESKVQARIDIGQLKRHVSNAERRGFGNARLLLLSIESPPELPDRCFHRHWVDVYRWANGQSRASSWARRFAEFMEVTEAKMLADGYLTEGTLTAFSGIHFDARNPYSYAEAKRLLKLIMEELRKRPELVKKLTMLPEGIGRGAIKGQDAGRVWDFLRIKAAKDDKQFTKFPHLTFSIETDRAIAQITIPNGLGGELRRKLKATGYEGFRNLVAQFVSDIDPILKGDAAAAPIIIVVQRHYRSQSSEPICDARLEFDPRTALAKEGVVKFQEQWLRASYEAFEKKTSNIQVGIGVQFPFAKSQAVQDGNFIDLIEKSFLACSPFLTAMDLID